MVLDNMRCVSSGARVYRCRTLLDCGICLGFVDTDMAPDGRSRTLLCFRKGHRNDALGCIFGSAA